MNIWIAGSPKEVMEAAQTGLVSAVVTNPTVVADWTKDGQPLEAVATSVIQTTGLPLYIQLCGPNRDQFLREADYLKNVSQLIIPKIPATLDGLAAARILENKGVKTLITTVCSLNQAYVAAVAGVVAICPYYSRLRDHSEDAARLIRDVADMYRREGVSTRIQPASVRSVEDVAQCILNGADGVIVFYDVFRQLTAHPVSDKSLANFENDWRRIKLSADYPS